MDAQKVVDRSSAMKRLSILAVVIMLAGFLHPAMAQPLSAGPVDNPDFAAIDRYVEDQMADCRIPGFALGIIRGNDVLYTKGYGTADEADRPVTPQTPFIIASVSKTFTALALMQLKEDGKVDLDMPVSHYLPDLNTEHGITEEMTVRQLLNHTAGLAPHLEFRVTSPEGNGESIADLVRKFGNYPLSHAPGARFEYNNAGYIVLGEVISQVSGLSYEQYMQQHIFDPLEMRHSFTSTDRATEDGLAIGYRTIFGYPRVSGLTYVEGYLPAFGIISSAEDLAHYMIALLNGGQYKDTRILSEGGVSEMLTPSASVSPFIDYGLGWYVTSGSFYHGGELTDYQAKVKVLPEDELGVVLLYNTSSSMAATVFGVGYREKIETGIINILYGVSPTDQPGQSLFNLNSHPMALTYLLMLVVPLLAVALLVWSALRLRTLPERLEKSRFDFWSNLILSALLFVLLPLYILITVPKRGVSWPHVLYYRPDVGWSALILSVLLIALGVCRGVIVAVFLKNHRYPEY